MVPVGLGIAVTIVIGRCGYDGMIGCTVPPPVPVDPVPVDPVPVDPVPVDPVPVDPVPVDPVPPPLPPAPVPVPADVPAPAAPAEPAPASDAPVPPLPLVIAAVPVLAPVAAPAGWAWCTGRITATAAAAADARLPAMAAALANVVMSDLLLVRPRRRGGCGGLFRYTGRSPEPGGRQQLLLDGFRAAELGRTPSRGCVRRRPRRGSGLAAVAVERDDVDGARPRAVRQD